MFCSRFCPFPSWRRARGGGWDVVSLAVTVTLGALCLAGVGRPAHAQTLVFDPAAGVTGQVFPPLDIDLVIGYAFNWEGPDTSLTGVGIWDQGGDGLVSSHDIGIYSSAVGANLAATATVPSGANAPGTFTVNSANAAGVWRFVTLPQPLLLTAGTLYVVEARYRSTSLTAPHDPIAQFDTFNAVQGASFLTNVGSLGTDFTPFPGTLGGGMVAGPGLRVSSNAPVSAVTITSAPEPGSLPMAVPAASMLAYAGARWRGKGRPRQK